MEKLLRLCCHDTLTMHASVAHLGKEEDFQTKLEHLNKAIDFSQLL